MFKADFLIDDKDVVKLHYALGAMKVFNVSIRPVRNAAVNGDGGEVTETTTNGTMPELVADRLRKEYSQGATLGRAQIFEIARGLGYAPNSVLPTRLMEAKVIKKKARGEFIVLSSAAK